MTLTQLKYCIALTKTKNFGKAAKLVYVSQPTLSLAIKKLEDELEVNLFERQKNKVLVTEIGKKIIAIAENIQHKVKQIKNLAENENNQTPIIRIGAIYTIGPYLFPSLLFYFNQHYPNIKLSIEENYTAVLTKKLKLGEIDFILVAEPFEEDNILTRYLYTEPFIAALPTNHHLNHKTNLKITDLKNEIILLLGAGHCFRDQILDSYPELNNSNQDSYLQKTLEGTSLETIRYMVAGGNGITLLPYLATKQSQNLLKYIPIINPIPSRNIIVAYRQSFSNNEVLELLVSTLKKLPLLKNLQ